MRVKTKSFYLSAILIALMALLVLFVVFMDKPTTASAKTTHSANCVIQGRVEYPLDSYSAVDVKNNFTIEMSATNPTGTGILEQHAKIDWSSVRFRVNVKSLDAHRWFALYRDGEEYYMQYLSGKSSMILYDDTLPDGEYKMVYAFGCSQGSHTYPTLYYVYYFSIDTTSPEYTVTAGGEPISYYSYTNKPILYSVSDPNFDAIYYKEPKSTTYGMTLNKYYLVEAKASNTGWWEFHATDTYGNTTLTYFKVYLDCTLPTLSCSSEAAFGGTTRNDFTVTATDDSGTAKLYVKYESEEWFYADGDSYTVPMTERNGRYYFYAEDRVGNRTQTSWIVLSTEDPAGRLIKSDSDNSVSFVWNNEYWTAKLDGANYTEGRIISSEGQHVIELTNNAGKKKTYTFRIDHCYKVISQTEPTCSADGKRVSKCSQCGDTFEEVLYSTGHIYSVNTTPSSCTEKEHLIYTCSRCGDRYEAEGNYPSGHSYTNEVITEPTCTEDGLRRSTCENCGYSFDTVIEANGHDYNITDSTSKDGITTRTYTCSDCGDSYKQELGDQYEEVSNYVEYLFKQYEPYMWLVLLAASGVWSIVIGVMIAIAHKNEDKDKARKMLINYAIGMVVIAVIFVACPYIIRGIAALVT